MIDRTEQKIEEQQTKTNSVVVVVVAGIQLIIPEVGGKSFFSDAFK